MKTHHLQGANILKRVIEHLCSGPWDENRADALEIANWAIETCFESENIAYESADGRYWIARRVSTDASIAPLGSVYYQMFKTGICVSKSTGYVSASLERAKVTCDNLARVTSEGYRRVENSVTRHEKAIRRGV